MSRMVMLVTILIQSLLTGCQTFPTSQADTSNRVSPLLNLADAYIARGDLTEALPLVIQAEAIAPSVEPVQLERAEILARQGGVSSTRPTCVSDSIRNHPLLAWSTPNFCDKLIKLSVQSPD